MFLMHFSIITYIHRCLLSLAAKKNLAPSAMAGLAAKLDFTTVKLRKTGIVDKMIAQQAGMDPGNILHSPNPSAGNEHNTVHPVMLLKVKGKQ